MSSSQAELRQLSLPIRHTLLASRDPRWPCGDVEIIYLSSGLVGKPDVVGSPYSDDGSQTLMGVFAWGLP